MNTNGLGPDDEATFQRLLQELDPAAEMQQAFRPSTTFRALEKALSLEAWLLWTRYFRSPEERSAFLAEPSAAARAVATVFVERTLSEADVARRIRDAGIPFDPATEVRQAWAKDTTGAWNASLTRAIIMITRGLVFRTVGEREAVRSPFLWSVANDHRTERFEERARAHTASLMTRQRPVHTIDFLGSPIPLREEVGGEASAWMPYLVWSCAGGVIRDGSLRMDACGRTTITPLGVTPIASICPHCGSIALVGTDLDARTRGGADAVVLSESGDLTIRVYRVYPRKGDAHADLTDAAYDLSRVVSEGSHRGALVSAIGVGDERHRHAAPYVREIRTDKELLGAALRPRRAQAEDLMRRYVSAADEGDQVRALAFVQRAVTVDPANEELAAWLRRF
jgi:hypothetical protein